MNILITGINGFIGFHVSRKLIEQGHYVIGIGKDIAKTNDMLKAYRRNILEKQKNFISHDVDLANFSQIESIFQDNKLDKVIHLAAQSGERAHDIDPFAYTRSNSVAFHNLIELARLYSIQNFLYASTASVYGKSENQPLSISENTDKPLSIYAATKKANELMAHAYSYLYELPTTGLRFFTVYGPYGRPDMAIMKFAEKIMKGESISIYNYGDMARTFIYIDDAVNAIIHSLNLNLKYEILNIGSETPVQMSYIVTLLEKTLNRKAITELLPMPYGDVPLVSSDIQHTKNALDWSPEVSIEEGIRRTMKWFLEYNQYHYEQ